MHVPMFRFPPAQQPHAPMSQEIQVIQVVVNQHQLLALPMSDVLLLFVLDFHQTIAHKEIFKTVQSVVYNNM